MEKPNREILKTTETDTHVKTICPYCGVGCQLELAVKNNRIVRVNGVAGVKPNDGRLCVKGRFGYEFVGSRDRLTRPLLKRNGQFVEADWNEALDFIAAKFTAIKENY